MELHRVERKLAAILHADVQGYSRLIGEDEVATLRVLATYLEMMNMLVQRHGGRAVGSRGDSLLAEFPSVVEAVQCAVEMLHELTIRNTQLPVTRRVEFRMGINLGEIVVEGEQIHGEGINIAVRLEGLAEAGGIFISEIVYEQVKNRLPLPYEYVGERTLKNIERPVRVWQVVMEDPSPLAGEGQLQSPARQQAGGPPLPHGRGSDSDLPLQEGKKYRVGIAHLRWVVAGLMLLVGTIAAVRYFSHPPLSTQDSALRTEEAQPPSLPLPDKPSIIVLPFVNMSKDPDQEYFSDGLTDVLTGNLSKISSLFVIARNSAFTYKGKAVKVQDVGREMGVRYVLEGSVQRADQRVRITTQLIDATTGYHLWAEQYDRPLHDLFALQDEIVQQIVAALRVEVMKAEQARVRHIPTENLTAYDFYLRGLETWFRAIDETNKEANMQARQLFEKALELDPRYAEAYVGLSVTYFLDRFYGWNSTPQVLEQFSELAHKAVALDASLPVPHQVLSYAYLFKRQHEQAVAEAERALALDPNSAEAHRNLGVILIWAGRPEEAIEWIQKGMRLNPRYEPIYLVNLGWAYMHAGQWEEALVPLKRALPLVPNSVPLHWNFTICYAELRREEQARAEAAELLRLIPDFSLEYWRQILPFKDPAMLERELAALRKAGFK